MRTYSKITLKNSHKQAFIRIDHREKKPFKFGGLGIPIIRTRFPIADYSCGDILIERKSLSDILDSVSNRIKKGEYITRWEALKKEVQEWHDNNKGTVLFVLVEASRNAVLSSPHNLPMPEIERRLKWLECYSGMLVFCRSRTEAEQYAQHLMMTGADVA